MLLVLIDLKGSSTLKVPLPSYVNRLLLVHALWELPQPSWLGFFFGLPRSCSDILLH